MTAREPVLLITGASGGIGAATARLARAAGWRLVLLGRSPRVTELALELGGETVAQVVLGDVTSLADLQHAVGVATEEFGGVDAAFVNAGITAGPHQYRPETAQEPVDGWQEMVLTNVLGTALTVRAVSNALVESRGRLVITGSVLGRYAMSSSFYSATKYAVAGIAETVRLELLGSGVGVTLVEPGPVATKFSGAKEMTGDVPALAAVNVAQAVLFALSQPSGVDVNELLIRPHGATP